LAQHRNEAENPLTVERQAFFWLNSLASLFYYKLQITVEIKPVISPVER
jgi:hypothetical protein